MKEVANFERWWGRLLDLAPDMVRKLLRAEVCGMYQVVKTAP